MKIKLFTIPNLLTLSNLLCGMIATVAILTDGDLHLAFWLLVLAAVFDFFDGFTARLLHQSSPIGLQLDSLADMVSSGVAPTAVMLTLAWQAGSSWWTADTGPFELDRTAAGRRDGAAAGEIQHRRHAAYRVLRTPFARGGPLLRLAGSAPRRRDALAAL